MTNPRATVWIIDDSPTQAEACRRALVETHDVVVFVDPAKALEVLAVGPPPDVILLDWYMPIVSGPDALAAIREMYSAAALPTLIVTAEQAKTELVVALNAGANDLVVKPFSDIELQARIDAFVRAKRLYEDLTEAERKLREEASFRERFIAVLAHDLRQPLNTLLLATNVVLSASTLPDRTRVAGRMANTVTRMDRLIEQLLDFTRARRGTIPITREEMRLDELATSILSEFREAHPTLKLELAITGDCRGSWDWDRLAQVCTNLLGNAVTHGASEGAVTVDVTGHATSVEIVVTNTGGGIPRASLATIFEPFRQGKPSREGLGLGLYIVKEVVTAHGGEVTVTSDDEHTTFTVKLPR